MKKSSAEIIIKMADEHGNVLFDEPEFCVLYEKANKYINKLINAKIKRKKNKGELANLNEQEIDEIIKRILE